MRLPRRISLRCPLLLRCGFVVHLLAVDVVEELARGLGSQLPEINGASRNAAFPASLSMYNLGIKSTRLQHTTLESVKYLANMKNELHRAIQDTAVNRK